MTQDMIILIYEKRLNEYRQCSYGAFLKNWSNYGWKIINKKMKGILKKTEEGWFVIFDQRTMQDPSAEDGMLPLSPEYQRILPLDLDLDGKEVDFEISMYDGKSHISNAWNGYAKLIDKEEPCCTPKGQIKKYVDCIGCDSKPYPVLEDCKEVKNWDSFAEKKNVELLAEEYAKQFDYTEDSSPQLDFISGYNKAKETMYTEEQVREAIKLAHSSNRRYLDWLENDIIQSLTQK